jgi:hypothetical protein
MDDRQNVECGDRFAAVLGRDLSRPFAAAVICQSRGDESPLTTALTSQRTHKPFSAQEETRMTSYYWMPR